MAFLLHYSTTSSNISNLIGTFFILNAGISINNLCTYMYPFQTRIQYHTPKLSISNDYLEFIAKNKQWLNNEYENF